MYNPEQRQAILKNSLGVSYHVFHESGRGLCVRMLGDDGIWSRGYILSDLSVNDFSVILDKEDIFHFVFLTMDGRILYGHGRHGQIEIQPILTGKDTTAWIKHVSLLEHAGQAFFFYMIKYQNRYMLSMQTMKDDKLKKPVVVDYIDGPGRNYHAFMDTQGRCHLIYVNDGGTVKRLNHRILNKDTGLFSAPVKICSSEHDIAYSSAVCIHEQIHLLYQIRSENLYQVFYKKVEANKEAECLYKSNAFPGYTSLVWSAGKLRFYRVLSDKIYVRSSDCSGENWDDEILYPFGNGGALTCFTYFSNYAKELPELACHELPGNFSRGYQLAFLSRDTSSDFTGNLFSESSEIRSPVDQDERSSRFSGRVHSNEKQTSEPENNALKELQKKVMLLQNLTGNMQRELTKLWLMQKEYEKKMDLLARSYARLKKAQPTPRKEDLENMESMAYVGNEEQWETEGEAALISVSPPDYTIEERMENEEAPPSERKSAFSDLPEIDDIPEPPSDLSR